MDDFLITIVIPNYNSADFTLNALYCLKKLTKNRYKVIIRDDLSEEADFSKLKKFVRFFPNVDLYRAIKNNYTGTGSMSHGIALNELVAKIDTKYGVILDADCTFLHKHWDDILINELDNKHPIIGTQGPPYIYQDFPFVYAILFINTILQELKVNFTPLYDENILIHDTGFRAREIYLENGFKGKVINYKHTRSYKDGPFRKLVCQEFYLAGYERIFATHFWKGSEIGRYKYYKKWKKMIRNFPIIGIFLFRGINRLSFYKGNAQKFKWIKTCRKIVKNYC